MTARLTIGEFAFVTHLSKKALRHYHEVGLLEPAHTDPHTGYRHYGTDQVAQAQIIRCYRGLDMPLPDVKAVLGAESAEDRNAIIAAHLTRMEDQLRETGEAVRTLRELLTAETTEIDVEFRTLPAVRVWALTNMIALGDYHTWYADALQEIRAALAGVDQAPLGPLGGLTTRELFTEDTGRATLFVPTDLSVPSGTRLVESHLPPARYAIAVHDGDRASSDLTCGALGSYVTERHIGVSGPVREHYMSMDGSSPSTTEICWPVMADA
ncbi:MerR family transcriptional regulator [Streptomyces sp. BH-SS-21]|uniref:MerR family transcriptional regulator n=1 Tax=Streptomyces liliiviolaceus TaxID=2823109 RepID=A0A940XV20_9ACTN|nr:MerR family transcriptional regulator [Streptomyces liliiviolaceus]MBQ0850681.1 MerR family transcriptional regulator [Streptomyces liliiviolaceus]